MSGEEYIDKIMGKIEGTVDSLKVRMGKGNKLRRTIILIIIFLYLCSSFYYLLFYLTVPNIENIAEEYCYDRGGVDYISVAFNSEVIGCYSTHISSEVFTISFNGSGGDSLSIPRNIYILGARLAEITILMIALILVMKSILSVRHRRKIEQDSEEDWR